MGWEGLQWAAKSFPRRQGAPPLSPQLTDTSQTCWPNAFRAGDFSWEAWQLYFYKQYANFEMFTIIPNFLKLYETNNSFWGTYWFPEIEYVEVSTDCVLLQRKTPQFLSTLFSRPEGRQEGNPSSSSPHPESYFQPVALWLCGSSASLPCVLSPLSLECVKVVWVLLRWGSFSSAWHLPCCLPGPASQRICNPRPCPPKTPVRKGLRWAKTTVAGDLFYVALCWDWMLPREEFIVFFFRKEKFQP